jgi:hypothetical protein
MKAETFVTDFTNASAVRVPARAPRWVVPLVKLGLLLGDATLALACFVAAFYVRHYQSIIHQSSGGSLSWSHDFAPYAVLLPLIIPIRLLLLRYYDLYRVRGEFSVVDDIASVFKATGDQLAVDCRGGVYVSRWRRVSHLLIFAGNFSFWIFCWSL